MAKNKVIGLTKFETTIINKAKQLAIIDRTNLTKIQMSIIDLFYLAIQNISYLHPDVDKSDLYGSYIHIDYDDFIEMTDIEEIALAFAKCYERCGSGSYDVRQSNALIAFEYFAS